MGTFGLGAGAMNQAFWNRRLAAERPESRNPPGVFLASWPTAFAVDEPLAVSPVLDDHSVTKDDVDAVAADRTERTHLDTEVEPLLLAVAGNRSDAQNALRASPAISHVRDATARRPHSLVAESVRLDVFASLRDEPVERAGRAAIDIAPPLPIPNGRVSAGGGGSAGGSVSGGDGHALAEPVAHGAASNGVAATALAEPVAPAAGRLLRTWPTCLTARCWRRRSSTSSACCPVGPHHFLTSGRGAYLTGLSRAAVVPIGPIRQDSARSAGPTCLRARGFRT